MGNESQEVTKFRHLEERFRNTATKDHTGDEARAAEAKLQQEVDYLNKIAKTNPQYLGAFLNKLATADEKSTKTHGAFYPTVEIVNGSLRMKPLEKLAAEDKEARLRKHDYVELQAANSSATNLKDIAHIDRIRMSPDQASEVFHHGDAKSRNALFMMLGLDSKATEHDVRKEAQIMHDYYCKLYGLPNSTSTEQLTRLDVKSVVLDSKIYSLVCASRGMDIDGRTGVVLDQDNPAEKQQIDLLVAQKRIELQEYLNELNHESSPFKDKQTYVQHMAGGMAGPFLLDTMDRNPQGGLVLRNGHLDVREELKTPQGLKNWAEYLKSKQLIY